jgi:hypothetical protein
MSPDEHAARAEQLLRFAEEIYGPEIHDAAGPDSERSARTSAWLSLPGPIDVRAVPIYRWISSL